MNMYEESARMLNTDVKLKMYMCMFINNSLYQHKQLYIMRLLEGFYMYSVHGTI